MSEQVIVRKDSGRVIGRAIAGVVFSDFIGVLLFALPEIGWLVGLAVMFTISPLVAWVALEDHPRRRALTWRIGIGNAVVLTVVAIALSLLAIFILSGVQFG